MRISLAPVVAALARALRGAAPATSPLRVRAENLRYFADPNGVILYTDTLASPADWFSPGLGEGQDLKSDLHEADGTKVSLVDTDHVWGVGGSEKTGRIKASAAPNRFSTARKRVALLLLETP